MSRATDSNIKLIICLTLRLSCLSKVTCVWLCYLCEKALTCVCMWGAGYHIGGIQLLSVFGLNWPSRIYGNSSWGDAWNPPVSFLAEPQVLLYGFRSFLAAWKGSHVVSYHLLRSPCDRSAHVITPLGRISFIKCFFFLFPLLGWHSETPSLHLSQAKSTSFPPPSPFHKLHLGFLLCLHHSSSRCKYTSLLTENSRETGFIPLIFPTHFCAV